MTTAKPPRRGNATFGYLLRDCRTAIELDQTALAKEIPTHGSMISKYEHDTERPTKPIALHIIDVLARHGAPDAKIEKLLEAAQQLHGESEVPLAHPALASINRRFQKKSAAEAEILAEALLTLADIVDDLIQAQRLNAGRKWRLATELLEPTLQKCDSFVGWLYLGMYKARRESSYSLGNYKETARFGEMARLILSEMNDSRKFDKDRVENHLRLGVAYRRQAMWLAAERELAAAQALLSDDPVGVATCRRKLTTVYILQSQVDKALDLCELAQKEVSPDDLRNQGKLQQMKAWALSLKGKWDAAIRLYQEAGESLEKAPRDADKSSLVFDRARGYRYLADVYSLRSEWHGEAERLYRQALEIIEGFERNQATDEIRLLRGMILRGLGRILTDQVGSERQAREYLERSESLFVELEEPIAKSMVFIDKGRLLTRGGLFEPAKAYLELAKDELLTIRNLYWLGESLAYLCELHYLKGKTKSSGDQQADFAEVYRVYQAVPGGNVEGLGKLYEIHNSKILSIMGRVHMHQGQFEAASDLLCQATKSGLSYNRYVYKERFGDFVEQLELLISTGELGRATTLCDQYRRFWQGRMLPDPMDELEVAQSLMILDKKEKQVEVLVANRGGQSVQSAT